ncbi:hybrid sensor histidine kinase/response regulator [Desulfobacterales bacterium HSG2]|nr:hybrid sensor histidine kinase/response regulator [Desulfobacterales bacterium HSG2]
MSKDSNRKFKVLIVDDVPKNIQLAGSILQKEGYHISFANNGNTALNLTQTNDFDLILLDIMMPEMDGFEVCDRLKQKPETKEIPIIFLTAKTGTESTIKGFDIGAVDYVTKPFNEKELLARVRTHLELRDAQKNLREANATKDKFFSIIAHDLKNPFNALLGLSKLLLQNFDIFDDDKKKHFIEGIFQSSEQGYKLLENLLDWSRIQTGKIDWKPAEIDLYTYAFENVSLLKIGAENKKISLHSDISKDTIIYADANMVTMIVRNLVSNAIKFTNEGGEVKITSETKGDDEEITISDTGVGIKPENIKKLFRIDAHHSTLGTANEQGTGLGLILCREFIEKNGGKIWIESEVGKGSEFKFTLPKSE